MKIKLESFGNRKQSLIPLGYLGTKLIPSTFQSLNAYQN